MSRGSSASRPGTSCCNVRSDSGRSDCCETWREFRPRSERWLSSASAHDGRGVIRLPHHGVTPCGGAHVLPHGAAASDSTTVSSLEIRKADGSKGIRLYVDSVAGLLGLVDMGVVGELLDHLAGEGEESWWRS
jgi:hypothetical protein